jgi:hypothetical protein
LKGEIMLALDPTQTFEVSLETDPRAKFRFRYFTFREFRDAGKVYDRATSETFDAVCDGLIATIRRNLVGWSGIIDPNGHEVSYDPDVLEDVLTHREAWDLLGEARKEGRITSAEKNASGSSLPTDGGPSAGGAVGSVQTGPA